MDEALAELDGHIERLRHDDLSQLDALRLLFAPTGSLQETSISGGWGEEFITLATQFDQVLKALRRSQRH